MEDGLVDYLEDEGDDGTDEKKSQSMTIFDITAESAASTVSHCKDQLLLAQGGHIQIGGVQS